MGISKEEDKLSKEKLYEIRKSKIKSEIAAAVRLLNQNIEPLEVADKFIHDSLEIMKEGISLRNPKLTQEEIKAKIQKIFSFSEKIKSNQKRGKNLG